MEMFGGRSPWDGSAFSGRPALGQVPLILGPSSWGAGSFPVGPVRQLPQGVPPYWGEWGYVDPEGTFLDGGRVGPFSTIEEAFAAASEEAAKAGATEMPLDGFAQVKDSTGRAVGPIV